MPNSIGAQRSFVLLVLVRVQVVGVKRVTGIGDSWRSRLQIVKWPTRKVAENQHHELGNCE